MSEEFIGAGWPSDPDRPTGSIAVVTHDREIEESIRLIVGTAQASGRCGRNNGCAIHDYVFATIDPTPRAAYRARSARRSCDGNLASRCQGVDVTIDRRTRRCVHRQSATRSATPTTHGTWCFPSTRFRRRIAWRSDSQPRRLAVSGARQRKQRMVPQKCPEWTATTSRPPADADRGSSRG